MKFSICFFTFLFLAAPALALNKKTYIYKTVSGHALRADVHRPKRKGLRPVVIWIHGGALIIGSRQELPADQKKKYLDAGYIVVAIDYRLAPETKLPDILSDITDAHAWLRGEGPRLFQADPERIAVVGHSAGGYLALASGYLLSPRPQAVVSFYGYGQLTGDWYANPSPNYMKYPKVSKKTADESVGRDGDLISETSSDLAEVRLQYYVYCRQNGLWPQAVSGGRDPLLDKDWFAPFEPLRHIDSAYPPTLLLHGPRDQDVPFSESLLLRDTLTRLSRLRGLISRPSWGHGFDEEGMRDPAVRRAFDQVIRFLSEALK